MAIATASVGAAGGIAKFFEGRAMQKRAQSLIDNFEWQDLTNPYENQQVSTLGSDLRTEQANINTATNVDVLRSGGNRAIVGGLGRVQAQNNTVNRDIASDLDKQQKQIDFAISGQDAKNQVMVEKRQADELAGYGQMLGMGQQAKFGGMTDIMNVGGFMSQTDMGKSIDKGATDGIMDLFKGKRPQAKSLDLSGMMKGINFNM
jgi:hypothetical protein